MKDEERESADVALIHGRTPDGQGLRIIRKRADQLELAAVHPLKNGVPITGEVVSLKPRPEFPLLCDVKTEIAAPERADIPSTARSGPPQVATDQYRENWDRIWNRKGGSELAN